MRFRLTSFDSDGREVLIENLECRTHVDAAAKAAGQLRSRTGWSHATLTQHGHAVASFAGPGVRARRLSSSRRAALQA